MVSPNNRGAWILKTAEVHKLIAAKRGAEPTVSRLEFAEMRDPSDGSANELS